MHRTFVITVCALAFVFGWETNAVAQRWSAPGVTTDVAGDITATGATLNGTVSANGRVTTYYFEYGVSTAYGQRTLATSIGKTATVQVQFPLTGLTSGTTYHFRLVASSNAGTSFGADSMFTTAVVSDTATPSVAAFTYSPLSPVTGSPVSFDGTSSKCGAAPCSYRWADDADNSLLGTGVQMTFTFQQTGTKYVRLTITDARALSASVEHDVFVALSASTPTITSFTPASGKIGAVVTITGTNFSGATAVRFNGTSASFAVVSNTSIQTTTPSGAVTGPLSIVTPGGTAVSANAFTVFAVPIPQFTYSPLAPVTGSPISLDASSSSCFATPCSYRWTDDADGSQLATGITASVTFQQTGTKRIRLTMTDAQSQVADIERDIVVSQPGGGSTVTGAYYVSTTGSDSNSGSSASPWKTIQRAANTLIAGDTVVVTAGTYSERVQLTVSGVAGKPITFQAQGTVVTKGFNIQASYVKVTGFEVANTSGTAWSDRTVGSGFYLSGSNNEISGNYIHDSVAAGIYFTSSANSTVVSGNRIAFAVECGIYVQGSGNLLVSNDISHTRSIGGSDADGIRFFGSGNTVRKNYIHDILVSDSSGSSPHIDAFQTWGPATNYIFEQNWVDKSSSQQQSFTIEGLTQPVGDIIIRNNVFITRGQGYQPDVNAGDIGLVTNVTVVGNTMAALNGSVEYAIWLFTNLRGAVIKDNAVYNHGNSTNPYIRVDAGASGLDIGFNAVFASNGQAPKGSPYPGDLWMVNPLFVNVSAGDFHLQSVSPLIDRGIDLSKLVNDYDAVARPNGLLTDIGAFEFHLP
jgi:parallel beta-helix repeat protein